VSYRVGAPAAQGGRFLAVWQFQLSVGQTLRSVPLALAAETTVMLHLEQTYQKAAADSYLG
jgi:hypothetical protein